MFLVTTILIADSFLFFVSLYADMVNGNKSLEPMFENLKNNNVVKNNENKSLEQVLADLKNKKVIKTNENTDNNESDKVTVDFEIVQTDINKYKRKLTINQKKQLFLDKLNDKDFLIISFKKWLDCGYSNFEEKDKEIKEFKKFVFHYNQYNWIKEEQAYHVTNPIRDKIKEAVLFLYPYYADKYGEKYFFSLLNGFHLFTYDIYHDGDSENNFFMYKNIHGYTINEVISLYQKADMLPLLLNTFHSIQVKQENNSTKYQIKKIVHVDEASNYIISPHIIYCGIKDIIFYLHIYQCSNEQIHQLYDDFCGVQLVDDILREAEKYASALNENNIDYFSFNKTY